MLPGEASKEEQSAFQRSQTAIDVGDVLPAHKSGPHTMRQMEGIDQDEAPGTRVFLHTGMQPFESADDSLQVEHVFIDGQRPFVFRNRQRSICMRLREMNESSYLSRLRTAGMTTNERVDQGRLADARGSFD